MQHFRKYMFSSVSMIVLGIALLARPGIVIHTGARILGICLMLTPLHDVSVLGAFTVDSLCVAVMVVITVISGAEYFIKNRKLLNVRK